MTACADSTTMGATAGACTACTGTTKATCTAAPCATGHHTYVSGTGCSKKLCKCVGWTGVAAGTTNGKWPCSTHDDYACESCKSGFYHSKGKCIRESCDIPATYDTSLHTALAAEGGGRNPVTSSFELIAAGAGGEKVRITRKGPTGLGDTIVVRLPTASMDMPLDDASKKFGEYFNSNTNELSMEKSVFNEKHKVEMEIEVLGDLYKFPVEFGPYTSKSDFTIKFPTQFLKDFGEFKILRNTQVRDITNEALRYQCRNKDSAGQFVDDPKCNVVTNKIDCEKLSCDWTDSPPPATLDQCVNICSARDIKRTGSVGNYIYTPNTLPGYKIYSKTTLGNSKTNYAKAGGQKLTGNSISTADLEATEVKIDKDSWMKSGKPSFIRNNFIKCGSAGKIEIKDENGGDLVSKCSNNTTQCLTEKTDKECSRYITLDRSKCSTMICPTNFRADSAKLATDCKGVPCKVDDKGTCCIENT